MIQLFVLTIIAILLLPTNVVVESRVVSGVLDTKSDTVFIDRFVFTPQDASLFKYDIKYRKIVDIETTTTTSTAEKITRVRPQPPSQNRLEKDKHDRIFNKISLANGKSTRDDQNHYFYRIVIYDDQSDQWPYVRTNENELTCWEKQEVAIDGGRPVISLSPHSNGACREITEDGVQIIHCQGWRSWTGYEYARWWFITLQNCGTYPEEGISLEYSFTMINGINPLNRHFSADKQYIFQTNITFMGAYVVLLAVASAYWFLLKNMRLLHVTFKLFYWSVILQLAALLCLTISLGLYAMNGVDDYHNIEVVGHVLSSLGTLDFILMTILVSKGFTITRRKISTPGTIKITVFMVLYANTYVVLYFYKEVMADPRDVMYLYDSPAGKGLIALRFFGTAWLYFAIVITLKHFPQNNRFYIFFALYFTSWFLAEPLMILCTNYLVESYQRAKIVNGCYWFVTLLGHLFWLLLTWPNKANKNFPYLIRRNQVNFSEIGDVDRNRRFIGFPLSDNFTNIFTVEDHRARYSCNAPPLPKMNNFFPEGNKETNGAKATDFDQDTGDGSTPAINVWAPKTDFGIFLGNALSEASDKPVPESATADLDNDITSTPVIPIQSLDQGDRTAKYTNSSTVIPSAVKSNSMVSISLDDN